MMRKRLLALGLMVVFGLILEATVFARLGAVKPDFLLVLAVIYGLLKGPWYGAGVGLGVGLVGDVFIGGIMGLGALSRAVAGFLVGLFEKVIFKDNLLVPLMAAFGGSIVADGLFLLLRSALGWPAGGFFPLFFRLIIIALYNAVLAPFVYRLFYRLEIREAGD